MKKPLLILLPLLLAAAVAPVRSSPSTGPAAPVRVNLLVDGIGKIRSFPAVLAERLGYFGDEGLLVTLVEIRDDIPTDEMLVDGRIDAAMAYYHHTIVSQAAGRLTEAIVTLGVTPGARVLVATASRDKFKSLADLKGSRIIAGGPGSSKTAIANALLIKGGNSIADYTRLAPEERDKILQALQQGKADLVVAPNPDGDYYQSKGAAVVFADLTTPEQTRRWFGTLFPTNCIYMSNAFAQAHRETAQRLANAFVKTLRFINTHRPEEIAALMPKEFAGKDKKAYIAALTEEMPMFATDGLMPDGAAKTEWEILAAGNPRYKAVDLAKTYTNEFAAAALARSHP